MSRLESVEGYEIKRARKALDMLLVDRKNEFKELSNTMRIPTTIDGWEDIILKFCLDFGECFKVFTSRQGPYDTPDGHTTIHKCMTLMRQLALGKKTVTEFTHVQNIAYSLSEEFKIIYRRIE